MENIQCLQSNDQISRLHHQSWGQKLAMIELFEVMSVNNILPVFIVDIFGQDSKSAKQLSTFSGRRMCLGESLAKTEVFLLMANVLHSFNVKFPSSQPNPPSEPAGGILQYPHPFKAIFQLRD